MAPTNSLERALVVVEMVGRRSGGMTNAEISRALKIATSSCSYMLGKLESAGYLTRDRESGRYEIGLRVVAIAQGALREIGLRQIAGRALHELAGATGLTANLGILDRGAVMLIDRVESPEFIKLDEGIGTRLPLHSTAIGKVLLAYQPTESVAALAKSQSLRRSTTRTITSPARLLDELLQIRANGWSEANEEQFPGARSAAAPVFDRSGSVVAAVGVAGASTQPIWRVRPRVLGAVEKAAQEISRRAARLSPKALRGLERHASRNRLAI